MVKRRYRRRLRRGMRPYSGRYGPLTPDNCLCKAANEGSYVGRAVPFQLKAVVVFDSARAIDNDETDCYVECHANATIIRTSTCHGKARAADEQRLHELC